MLALNSTAFNVWQIESDRSIQNPRQFLQCLRCSAVFSVWLNEEIYQGVFSVWLNKEICLAVFRVWLNEEICLAVFRVWLNEELSLIHI